MNYYLYKIIIKKFYAIPILILAVFRVEVDKLNIKFTQKCKGIIIIGGGETKLEDLYYLTYKNFHNAMVIKKQKMKIAINIPHEHRCKNSSQNINQVVRQQSFKMDIQIKETKF